MSECTGVFKKKQKKEPQERMSALEKKAEKMQTALSRVLQESGYANATKFFMEFFEVREEKRKNEEACKEWQQECVKAENSMSDHCLESQCSSFGDKRIFKKKIDVKLKEET